jgi:hypothetical protein
MIKLFSLKSGELKAASSSSFGSRYYTTLNEYSVRLLALIKLCVLNPDKRPHILPDQFVKERAWPTAPLNYSVQPVVSSEARILPQPVSVSTVFSFFCFSAEHSNNDPTFTQEFQ